MAPSLRQNPRKTPKALNAAASVSSKEEQEQQSSNMLQQAPPKTLTSKTSSPLRASPTRVQQKFANEQDGTKRMFFVVAGRRAKVLK
jgi:hypothetical protein